ncbi:MAG: extradiol ring-cleavage dioxygenase [Candidatus Binataceae bacterium]|nr:extradiol ring-cleavage dioxygenase [Candidatus Binataceae bacterium]
MAQILGIGLSHYPGPLVPARYWPRMLSRNVEIGRIKPELYRNQERWPPAMRAEYGADEGRGAAEEHRRRLLAGYAGLRAALDEFRPDVVLIWGDDQYENFRRDCIPAFCIGIFDSVVCRPYGGGQVVFKCEDNIWGIPPETEMPVRGHRAAAAGLCRELVEKEFDPAYAYTFRSEAGLAHSFNNTIVYLDYDRRGFPYPVIPFHVNCYGNQLIKTAAGAMGEGADEVSPPGPTPARCFALGRAVARYFAQSPWRVALIASSSWSHGSLTEKHGRLYPDLAADRSRHDELRGGLFNQWGQLDQQQIEESGQHEILNWVCLAGAMAELKYRATILDYVETYVFNSSKCFALFTPDQQPAARD